MASDCTRFTVESAITFRATCRNVVPNERDGWCTNCLRAALETARAALEKRASANGASWMLHLRDYQKEAIEDLRIDKSLMVGAMAGLMASMFRNKDGKTADLLQSIGLGAASIWMYERSFKLGLGLQDEEEEDGYTDGI